ncbi:hypothetical protein AAG906_005148 [Vitis piasezkii]
MSKIVARRLEKLQKDFLWGGGNLERKAHLVNWEVVCADKDKGGLGLRKLALLNKALLGKWIWRFVCDKDNLWKQVILAKYGQEGLGWRTKKLGMAPKSDSGLMFGALVQRCPKASLISLPWLYIGMLRWRRWDLLHVLRGHRPSLEEDSEAYSLLANPIDTVFPKSCIWVDRVPTKVAFFAREATWGKVLTLNRLQKRGWQLPNCCFLCGCEEESVNHILIHCIVVRVLWDIVLRLLGVKWGGGGEEGRRNVMLESNNNPEEGTALVVSKPHGAEGTVVAVTANAGNLGRSEVESRAIKTPNKETDLTLNNFRY